MTTEKRFKQSFILTVHFVAQRIDGARETLDAGSLAKAERSSEERKAASDDV